MNNKIRFEDWNVWFDMRGSGPIPVLFIPGFLGKNTREIKLII